jgi:serine/threonine protein kinase
MRIVCRQCGYRFEQLPPGAPGSDHEQACPECGASVDVGVQIDNMASQTTDAGDDIDYSTYASDSLSRRSLGEYDILDEISRGAMGVIYKARHRELGRVVALKVMIAGQDASPDQIVRFEKEARAAARLRHPNIVPIYDIGREDGKRFFTMDLIEGMPLDVMISRGELTPRRALEIAAELGDALAYAHERGVIHRDIKPSNIIVDSAGRPQITDFGLAKQVDTDTKFTRTGTTIGTPSYMSPEQARGENERVDHRSDVYSLGAVLHEMLIGQPPFTGETMMNIVMKVIHDEPVPLRKINPKLHRDIETIVLKAMEKEVPRRYQSMTDLANDVRRYMAGEMISARPAGPLRRAGKFVHKYRTTLAVALIITVLVSGVSGAIIHFLIKQQDEARIDRDRAENELRLSMEDQTPEWVEKFRDEFTGPKLTSDWKPSDKQWTVKDGRLVVKASKKDSYVELDRPLTGKVRIDFTASTSSPESRINCWLGVHRRAAYSIRFGAWEGHNLSLLRLGRTLAQVKCPPIKPDTLYRFRIERRNTVLTCRITGGGQTHEVQFEDPMLLKQMRTMRFGLDTWDATVAFDDVSVSQQEFTGPEALRLNVMQFIDSYIFSQGQLQKALSDYRDLIRKHGDTALAVLAEHNCGLIQEAMGSSRQKELLAALNHYRRFESRVHLLTRQHRPLIEDNRERIFFVLAYMGEYAEAARELATSAARGQRLDAATVWAVPGIVSRCAGARAFDSALQIMESARFKGPLPTLRDQWNATGGRVRTTFGKAAVEVCAGLASQKKYAEMKRAFLALPTPRAGVTFEVAVAQAMKTKDAPAVLDLLAFSSQHGMASRKLEALANQLAQSFLAQKQYARIANVHTAYPAAGQARYFGLAVAALVNAKQLRPAQALLEDGCKRFAADKKDLRNAAGALMTALLAEGAYDELRRTYAMIGDPRFARNLTDAAARMLKADNLTGTYAMLEYVRENVSAALPDTDRLAAELAAKYVDAGRPETVPVIARKYPKGRFAPAFAKAITVALNNENRDLLLNLMTAALGRHAADAEVRGVTTGATRTLVEAGEATSAARVYTDAAATLGEKETDAALVLRLGGSALQTARAYRESADLYTRAALIAPERPDAPQSMLRAGLLHTLLGDAADAAKTWAWLAEKHANSPAAVVAKLMTGALSAKDFAAWQAKNPKKIGSAEAAFYMAFKATLSEEGDAAKLRSKLKGLTSAYKNAWFHGLAEAALDKLPEPPPPPDPDAP